MHLYLGNKLVENDLISFLRDIVWILLLEHLSSIIIEHSFQWWRASTVDKAIRDVS